ncbi:MAG: GNAT family N-acetyltransferase [Candidatus Geothermincolia bacterium]
MNSTGFIIRPFDPCRDMDAVIRCYESGYGGTLGPLFEFSDRAAIEDIVMTDHRASSISLAAEAGGEARGILFGNLPAGPVDEVRQIWQVVALLFRRMVTRRSEMQPLARAVLRHSVSRELLYFSHMPRGRAAEVSALTSQERWRSGIGTALMDAFIAEARKRGFGRVDLGTDTELNWLFYEKYGFRRVAEWPQHAYDLSLPGREVTAFIYSRDI